MKRQIIYPGQIPLETDLLGTNKNVMVALGKLVAATFGTSTFANGLGCVPTGPATLNVQVNPGEIYSLQNIDGTAYSSIAADTAHQIAKQGILLDAVTLAIAAPGTAGQSINYLIQATYSEVDIGAVVLPYYNASNPSQAYSGPANAGTTNNTARDGQVVLSAKAGISAVTGSQVTPAPDAGYIALWVVTVANGQATIVAGNITAAANQSMLPGSLLASIQGNLTNYAADTGTANTYVAAYTPAITAYVDGMVIWFKAKTANTAGSTLNAGPSAIPLVGAAHSALQGGEIVANGRCIAIYNATINSAVLVECTGGALQVAPATQSQHAVQMGQLSGVVGSMRNGKMSVTAASASATFTADEIILENVLGGLQYRLANYSKVINLATVGAGGMDTGAAPVSGFVALYAIYNPATQTAGILATNAATLQGNVYGGANMPAGYTASALIGVWPTNASSLFPIGYQSDRTFGFPFVTVASTGTPVASITSLSVATTIPANAKSVSGFASISTSSAGAATVVLASSLSGIGQTQVAGNSTTAAVAESVGGAFSVQVITPQTIFWSATAGGTFTGANVYVSGYTI